MATIVLVRLGPSTATSRRASSRLGMRDTMSMIRMITVSTQPRKAGDQAEDDAGRQRAPHHEMTDEQREAGAVDQAGQDIAADRIGAERKAPAAAFASRPAAPAGLAVLFDRANAAPRSGKDRRQHDQDDEHEARARRPCFRQRMTRKRAGPTEARRATAMQRSRSSASHDGCAD